jgi:hypothetical protein
VTRNITAVPVTGWPKNFRADPKFWGPHSQDHCPCGSMRRALNCHSDCDGLWHLPASRPLITGSRTGYSHPGCYASAAGDCDQKLSNEHWLSKKIIESAGGGRPVLVSGMPWQEGATHRLGANSLGSNILCQRHNTALSPLDDLAGEVFKVLRHYDTDMNEDPDPHGNEFAIFSGDLLERWAIKLFWGAVAASTLRGNAGTPVSSLRSKIDLKWLADVLFRDDSLPEDWGLYMTARIDAPFSGQAQVAIASAIGPDGGLWAGVVEFGVVSFRLCLGKMATTDRGVLIRRHPNGIIITTPENTRRKVLALAWDDHGSDPIIQRHIGRGSSSRNPSDL